jgi:hypothetical protein
METIHTIKVPAGPAPDPIPSPIGEWESAAGEVYTFHESMVSLSVEIDDDHALHLFCEADQVNRVPEALARLLEGVADDSATAEADAISPHGYLVDTVNELKKEVERSHDANKVVMRQIGILNDCQMCVGKEITKIKLFVAAQEAERQQKAEQQLRARVEEVLKDKEQLASALANPDPVVQQMLGDLLQRCGLILSTQEPGA